MMKTKLTPIRAFVSCLRAGAIALLTLLTVLPASANSTWTVPNEALTYDVMYKWGLINKKAGSVSLRTTLKGERFHAHLSGATASWADHFYPVRDTLIGEIDTRTFLPFRYEKIAHEDGDYTHDEVVFSRHGNGTRGAATHRRKRKKDDQMSVATKELTADGVALDMLSSFYYMRKIDYSGMKKGETVKVNVFSGRKKEWLTIHFKGIETVKIGKEKRPAYHITFTFTTDAGKVSSDNMDAWISTGAEKIPLLLEGKLPVGKVRALYSGKLPG